MHVRSSVRTVALSLLAASTFSHAALAAPISVVNASFEDTTGLVEFNEFFFGQPTGWDLFNPAVAGDGNGSNGIFTGTLEPNGTDFFSSTAPDGLRVAILFGFGESASAGAGAYGLEQTLGDSLQANTHYELTVEVGNITSGVAQDGTFFDLSGFPGYRVDLLAGGTIIAQDVNSLLINEGEFATATVSFTTGGAHALLGQSLGIRLVNLNQLPGDGSDIEVDFDDVRLTATSVPEPAALALLALGLVVGIRGRKRA